MTIKIAKSTAAEVLPTRTVARASKPRAIDELSTGRGSALRAQMSKLMPSATSAPLRVSDVAQVTTHHLTIADNATDLGVDPNSGVIPRDPAALQANVDAQLQALENAGIRDVRVWANPQAGQYGYPPDTAAMRDRLKIITAEAAKMGMKVTIDLLDLHRGSATDAGSNDAGMDATISNLITNVVQPVVDAETPAQRSGPNAVHWSIGNEPAIGPETTPQAFARWFATENAALASVVGKRQTVAELTTGALGDSNAPGWSAAAQTIAQSVGTVSVHFYPAAGTTPQDSGDYQTLLAWKQAASQNGAGFAVGEFGVDKSDPNRAQDIESWLSAMESNGISKVRLWQYLEPSRGQTDPDSLEADPSQANQDFLHQSGWLH